MLTQFEWDELRDVCVASDRVICIAISGAQSPGIPGSIYKIVAGTPNKANGEPYSEIYQQRVWSTLIQVNQKGDLHVALHARHGSPELANRLFFTTVATLSGRVRAGVNYTAERNTQFQGLAADGAKLAVARLVLRGFRVVGFVHDEILVELPDEGGYVRRRVVEAVVQHIRLGMQEVTCGVPVECEYALARCWSKRAKLIERGERILAWSPPAARQPTQRG